MQGRALRRRYGHAGEPWEDARDRLQALPADATEAQVAHALEPIGLGGHGGYPSSLVGHEANRVLALLDAGRLKSTVLSQARRGEHYDATALVRAVHAAREAKRTASGAKSKRTSAIRSLPEDSRRRIEFAKHVEAQAIDKAQAMEALAKLGTSPAWAARVARRTAQDETAARKRLEDELLSGKQGR